jgi:hypothetical protein
VDEQPQAVRVICPPIPVLGKQAFDRAAFEKSVTDERWGGEKRLIQRVELVTQHVRQGR